MPDAAPEATLPHLFGLVGIGKHPDAVLLTTIERYLHLRDAAQRRPERRGAPRSPDAGSWREIDGLEAEIGRIPACTALGARAKLQLALAMLPEDGAAHPIPVSALRDCLALLDADAAHG